jgi:hypothetical protein
MKRLTLDRNPMYVSNVGKASGIIVPSKNMKGFTVDRNPVDVRYVGKLSVL